MTFCSRASEHWVTLGLYSSHGTHYIRTNFVCDPQVRCTKILMPRPPSSRLKSVVLLPDSGSIEPNIRRDIQLNILHRNATADRVHKAKSKSILYQQVHLLLPFFQALCMLHAGTKMQASTPLTRQKIKSACVERPENKQTQTRLN